MRDRNVLMAMGGFAAGAGMMYWLDPRAGSRRRAEVLNQATHATHEVACATGKTARDLANRGKGLLAALRHRGRGGGYVDDVVLAERVRAKLGRYCSHPGAIEVTSEGGRVDLKGHVLDAEIDRIVDAVSRVRGVREVGVDLRRHKTRDVPALQGGAGTPPGERPELLQENWAPSTRLLVGTTGIGLVVLGARRPTLRPLLLGAGALLVTRAVTNLDFGRLLGTGAGRRGVDLRKSLFIAAPPDDVYAWFCAMENFPRFMEHVREVRRTGGSRYLWRVAGPAGMPIEWEAETTEQVPNQVVAWKSVPGSLVRSAGIVRFTPERDGTRLDVRLSYNPPAGGLGHAVAHLFGSDPKQQMDDDLLRLKSLIEEGKATGHSGTVAKEDLGVH